MTLLRWTTSKEYVHLGKTIQIPAWSKSPDSDIVTTTDDLRKLLESANPPSSWWQLVVADKRQFCHWINRDDAVGVYIKGLYVSDRDPPMSIVGAAWVETSAGGKRFTGRVRPDKYGEDMNDNWVYCEDSTYEFLRKLAEQFKKEQEFYKQQIEDKESL